MGKQFVDYDNAENLFAAVGDKYTPIPITKAEYDNLSEDDKASHRYIIIDYPDGDIIDLSTETVTGNPLSFTTDSEQAARSCVITFEPIQAGSGDPSPTNVREISGYKKVELKVTGKNLLNADKYYGEYKQSNGSYRISVDNIASIYTYATQDMVGKTYTFSVYIDSTKETSPNQVYTKSVINSQNTPGNVISSNSKGISAISFTPVSTSDYVCITYSNGNGTYINMSNLQIELGSTATAYEPYNPATDITLNLPETVYGSTLDVESGELTVTRERIDMGDLTWNYGSGSQVFSASISDKKDGNAHFVCEIYKDGGSTGYAVGNKEIAYNTGTNYVKTVFIKDTDYSTKETFTVAVTGKYLVYDLAEPYTLQLTPAQVRLLQGANVVTSNGTSITLTYRNGEVASLADVSKAEEFAKNLNNATQTQKVFLKDIDQDLSGKLTFKRCGNVVTVDFYDIKMSEPALLSDIIPTIYRPSMTYRTLLTINSSDDYKLVLILANGSIDFSKLVANRYFYGTFSYII